jgi:uncharacterized protein
MVIAMLDSRAVTLSGAECRSLLAPGGLGRVAVSVAALPAIFPVPFALVDDDVVFRVPEGSTLARALVDRVVAFEADGAERASRSGWSVLVVNRAEAIDDEQTMREAMEHGLDDWPIPGPLVYVRMPTTHISGHAVGVRSPVELGS